MNEVLSEIDSDVEKTGLTAAAALPSGIQREAQELLDRAKSVAIVDDAGYIQAKDFIDDIKAQEARLDADRVLLKAPFLAGTRRIDGYFGNPIKLCREAVDTVKRAMLHYDHKKRIEREEAERKAAEERRRLELAAQARAKAEREAAEAAERARLAEERQRREAAEAEARRAREAQEAAEAAARGDREAAAAADARAKQAEREATAAKEQARLDREKAIEARRLQLRAEREAAAAQDEAEKPREVAPEPVKVAGVSRKVAWKWRLVPNVAVPSAYLAPDEAKITAAVERLKDLAQETLGGWIEVYSEDSLAVGKGRGK